MWKNKQPLTQEKIQALEQLVEQFQLEHIEESNSPWNTTVFVIKLNSGKWDILEEIRNVNKTNSWLYSQEFHLQ